MTRRPKLGQHFLEDAQHQRRIAEALSLRPRDLLVEVGAGRGAMTRLLAERAASLIAIELDPLLATKLKEELPPESNLEVLQGDILTIDLARLCRDRGFESCFVFGNLPYYITSPILHHLFNFSPVIHAMGLVMQREVAERVTATPGRRDYGYLSVLAQLYSRPRTELKLPRGAFSPPPKVDSALVSFEMKSHKIKHPTAGRGGRERDAEIKCRTKPEDLLEFVKLCFAQKRKSVLNNLARGRSRGRVEQALRSMSLPLRIRAEQLTLEQFRDLHELLVFTGPRGGVLNHL